MSTFQKFLSRCGELVARIWHTIFRLVVFCLFPVSGVAASLVIGVLASGLVGEGLFGVLVFFFVTFFSALFLWICVWEPHIKRVILRVSDVIAEERK